MSDGREKRGEWSKETGNRPLLQSEHPCKVFCQTHICSPWSIHPGMSTMMQSQRVGGSMVYPACIRKNHLAGLQMHPLQKVLSDILIAEPITFRYGSIYDGAYQRLMSKEFKLCLPIEIQDVPQERMTSLTTQEGRLHLHAQSSFSRHPVVLILRSVKLYSRDKPIGRQSIHRTKQLHVRIKIPASFLI